MIIQTREQHWGECKAKGLPLPEIVRAEGNVKAVDVNTADIRAYDAETGRHTGWRKAGQEAQAKADWEAKFGKASAKSAA